MNLPPYDWARDEYECNRGDAEAKEARILADVKHWRCCGCGRDTAVDIMNPLLGPFSRCCGKPAYNCDDITNRDDTVSTTARLRFMRDVETEEAAP